MKGNRVEKGRERERKELENASLKLNPNCEILLMLMS